MKDYNYNKLFGRVGNNNNIYLKREHSKFSACVYKSSCTSLHVKRETMEWTDEAVPGTYLQIQ